MATKAPTKTAAKTTRARATTTPRAATTRKTASASNETGLLGGATGAMLGAAAAGVAVGLIANLGRKTAVQAPTYFAGEWDEALAAEHAATLKVFDAMLDTSEKNTVKRSLLLMQLKHALSKHALQEENVIYPALRDAGQTEEADHLNHDHGYVKQYLYDLENMPNESPAFAAKVAEFRAAVAKHAAEEEETIFPALKAKLSPERNKQLTTQMNKEGFKLA